ncbi:DUF2599 domain-containing protein [Curtobacterium sp. HSID17257]|uniref:DUF2599 domain-containing protein n=1 Tax=Curtobacterium sp. HSID17257 TaxID=2419510 RepID=UPI000F883B0C|nr:DUF2599 domain-containing protein [Curtobacterium sp. HSID17257]RUQ09433.1 DUF2599 domain-containing protein [Curtobacterium sp. HSID17257]
MAGTLGALALIGSLLVATPAQALNDTGTGGVFVPSTGRILDTKVGTGGFSTPMEAGKYRTIKVTGLAGLPDDGSVGAVSLNATVGASTGAGTLFGRPNTDTGRTTMLIYSGVSGQYSSNTGTVAVGADGTIQVMTETASRLILDVQGYYTVNTDGTAAGGFVPVAKRIVDTRSGLGAPKAAVAPGKSIDVQITGANGIPAGASAVVVNLIAINGTDADGYLTPYATGGTKPANALHYAPSESTSIQAQVPLSADGKITIANGSTTANVLVDLQGYFTAAGKGGAVFTPAYGRAYDSRATGNTALAENETRSIQIAGTAGVPVMGSGVTAVVLTLIVAHGGSNGYADAWADGTTKPNTSAINFQTSEIQTNTITVPLGANGKISLRNAAKATNYVVDVQGWYINPVAPKISCPKAYAAGTWTNVLPSSDITCTVSMPATGDGSGTLAADVNGHDTVEQDMSATGASTLAFVVHPAPGWYDISATSSYSGGIGGETHYAFGLNNGEPSGLVKAVQTANPEGFEDLANDSTTRAGVAASTPTSSTTEDSAVISTAPSEGVTLSAPAQSTTDPETGSVSTVPASTVALSLPFAAQATAGFVESAGVVSYDNGNRSSTVAVLKSDSSVQVNTVMADATAPTRYAYPLAVPQGATVAQQSDGSVAVTDANGYPLGGIAAAWAKDAAGLDVPTHYELDGSLLTQVITPDAATTFPVVADPYLGINVIDKVKWVSRDKRGKTLYVYPTVWGRSMAGLKYADKAGWAEVVKKAPSANTTNMWWQYKCHAQVAYWKPSWNLDSFLRRSSYEAYTSHLCN